MEEDFPPASFLIGWHPRENVKGMSEACSVANLENFGAELMKKGEKGESVLNQDFNYVTIKL